jgi:hypothetical protein
VVHQNVGLYKMKSENDFSIKINIKSLENPYLSRFSSNFSGSQAYDLVATRRILLCDLFPSLM